MLAKVIPHLKVGAQKWTAAQAAKGCISGAGARMWSACDAAMRGAMQLLLWLTACSSQVNPVPLIEQLLTRFRSCWVVYERLQLAGHSSCLC